MLALEKINTCRSFNSNYGRYFFLPREVNLKVPLGGAFYPKVRCKIN